MRDLVRKGFVSRLLCFIYGRRDPVSDAGVDQGLPSECSLNRYEYDTVHALQERCGLCYTIQSTTPIPSCSISSCVLIIHTMPYTVMPVQGRDANHRRIP